MDWTFITSGVTSLADTKKPSRTISPNQRSMTTWVGEGPQIKDLIDLIDKGTQWPRCFQGGQRAWIYL